MSKELWPATDGRRPETSEEWAKHNAHMRQARWALAQEQRQRKQEASSIARAEYGQAREAQLKAAALASYQRNGGNPAKFEEEWPGILQEYRRQRAAAEMQGDEPTRPRIDF